MPTPRHGPHGPRIVLALAGLLLALLSSAAPVGAHANLDRAAPAPGTAVPVVPTAITLAFTEPLEPRYSAIEVYDNGRQRHDRPPVRLLPGDPQTLVVDVGPLPEGTYTVVWKANSTVDGHTTTGSFAFSVGNTPPPPPDAEAGGTAYATPTPPEIAVKWLVLLAATTFIGALGLRLLVWAPTLRHGRAAGLTALADLAPPIGRRLTSLAGLALLVLFGATVAGLLLQVAKVAGRTVGGALDAALLADFLLGTRTGAIWSARLLLPLAAALPLASLVAGARRGARGDTGTAGDGTTGARLLLGAALGAGYLLTISLISHAAASPLWTPFTIAMDWIHLLATAVWVGGLAGLALTVPLLRRLPHPAPTLLALLARFSRIALLSAGALVLTGLYSAWLHVGALDALLPTDYGRALVGKLALVGGLVALGAFHLLWLQPRAAALAASGQRRERGEATTPPRAPRDAVLLRLFARSLRAEALLGVAVLLTVAALTGFVPAREAIVQARAPKRAQTLAAGDLRLTLTLSSLQPGDNAFDVLVRDRQGRAVPDVERVALRITHAEMDMGEAEAVATPRGDGHFVAAGPYLAMSGAWDLRAIVRRSTAADVEVSFRFPVGSTAALATRAAPPQPPRLDAPRTIGLLLLGLALLLSVSGVRLFRRGSGFGTAQLMLVPTALVVGAYLVYNGAADAPADGAYLVYNGAAEPPNPVVADAASIGRGGALFAQNCVACHGATGQGDGPQAATLNPRPPNLAQPHTAAHSDGYMFNAITNGFPGSAMPAWGDRFSATERWDLVNHLRQFNPLTAAGATVPVARPSTAPPPAASTPRPPGGGAAGTTTRAATAAAPTAVAGAGDERLIHAFDGGIWAISPQGGPPTNLTPALARDAYAGDPALSPDGATIAYTVVVVPAPVVQPPGTPGAALPGSDIWLMDRDGRNARQLSRHDRAGALIQSLTWTPDGRGLVYGYTVPVLGAGGRYVGSLKELQRLDPATGARVTLLKDAQDPGFSPGGGATPLAYVAIDPQTFVPSLRLADLDGAGGRTLVGPEGGFLSLSGPRFSPDGKTLVFAASGGPAAAGPARAVAPGGLAGRFARWLVAPFVPGGVAAHGPPADLWAISPDGGNLRRLTTLGGDDPLAAWSPDGRRIAFLTGGGLYIIEAATTVPVDAGSPALVKISDRGSYSTLNWYAPAARDLPGTPPAPAPATPAGGRPPGVGLRESRADSTAAEG